MYSHHTCSRRQLHPHKGVIVRVPRRGGEQPECERAACRMTKPFRRGVAASLLVYGEAWDRKGPIVYAGVIKETRYASTQRGWGLDARKARQMDRRGLSHCEVREESEPS